MKTGGGLKAIERSKSSKRIDGISATVSGYFIKRLARGF
jgi:hypothetical protein